MIQVELYPYTWFVLPKTIVAKYASLRYRTAALSSVLFVCFGIVFFVQGSVLGADWSLYTELLQLVGGVHFSEVVTRSGCSESRHPNDRYIKNMCR